MDCAHSIELLSDFRDGVLEEAELTGVRTHLTDCPPCACVYEDLNLIVVTAGELHEFYEISFPDEDVLWLRLNWNGRIIH